MKKIVPQPDWPDPDNEPLPPPVINSIQKKPPARAERPKITNFSIWTQVAEDQLPAGSEDGDEKAASQHQDEEQQDGDAPKLPRMTDKETRWVLQPKESKTLYVKFFSTKTGVSKQVLQFEIVGSYKPFNLTATAVCEFPSISQNPRMLYLSQKKTRPATEPDCFLSKTFVLSENVFDFGPLLIGKDPEKREEEEVKAVNGTYFQITNVGKYDLQASFTLRSTLPAEEGGPPEKSPFIIEPAEASLKVDETLELWVYAFPEEAKLYKDEVICLIKDNPNPTILQVQCLGARPIVNVDHEVVKFERALLGKQPRKELVLKNDCAIPVNWKLTGVDKLPQEFSVAKRAPLKSSREESKVQLSRQTSVADVKEDDRSPATILARTSGRLEPGKSEIVDIKFDALKE